MRSQVPVPVSLPPIPSELTFSDLLAAGIGFLGLMIAIASLIVTAAGVTIAVLAFYGYQFFKLEVGQKAAESARAVSGEVAEQIAGTTARAIVTEYIRGEMKDMVMQGVRDHIVAESSTTGGPDTVNTLSSGSTGDARLRGVNRYPKKRKEVPK